jgi:asparagine synthase (glutamine-hydrolysing)
MNQFVGVSGVSDPAAALRKLGVDPTWHDADVAFGDAPVWTDASGEIVVSGELLLDHAEELRLALKGAASPGCAAGVGQRVAPTFQSAAGLGRGVVREPIHGASAEVRRAEARRHGGSDGELLAELYRRHGAEAGRHALGMFAVAIWDRRRRQLLLLRDGVGARTLYYARDGRACWFATRLRSLRGSPAVSGEISLTALRTYLTFAFVPGAETMWRDVSELRPGTCLTLPDGGTRTYWEPSEGTWDAAESMEGHATRLRTLLEDAVRVRLPAAGPVGVSLSGGLDSSLVTALAARAAPGPVHTYAIHFGPPYPNELPFSQLVAEHCGTCHHVLTLPGRLIGDKLAETLAVLDDPIGDPLTVPNYLLGQAAAADTGVLLNGEGGDPCFGGPKNLPMLLHELYAPAGSREEAYFRSYQKCYEDLPRLLTPAVQEALRDAPPQEWLVAPFLRNAGMQQYLNRLMHLNVRLKGADHILTKVNNLTAANGLLGRSPLFDRRIVEASFAIPPEYKLEGANEKAVLKRAVADLLPEPILTRPKSGMLVPVQGWFQRDLRRIARGLLLSRRSRTRPYLNPEVVREWLAYRGNLWPRHGVKLWLLLTLEVWLRVNER